MHLYSAGFSGAEIANVVNEGSLLAVRKSQDHVTFRELLEGVQRTRCEQ
jgi:ATP-dependent Zn protease